MYATRPAFVQLRYIFLFTIQSQLLDLTNKENVQNSKMSHPITPDSSVNAVPPLNFIALLRQMLKTSDKVSDLIFSPGRPPQVELTGRLQSVPFPGLEKLRPAQTPTMAKLIIGNHPVPN